MPKKKKSEFFSRGNVNVEIERAKSEVCVLNKLVINGVRAEMFEIGYTKDQSPEEAEKNGCGDRIFVPADRLLRNPACLEKYNLSQDDLYDLLVVFHQILDVGKCNKCR